MAEKRIHTRFQIRRDTEDHFKETILAEGEPSYATDSHKFKIGDGKTVWPELMSIALTDEAIAEISKMVGKEYSDYEILRNKPRLNGIEIEGNHDEKYYGIAELDALDLAAILKD